MIDYDEKVIESYSLSFDGKKEQENNDTMIKNAELYRMNYKEFQVMINKKIDYLISSIDYIKDVVKRGGNYELFTNNDNDVSKH